MLREHIPPLNGRPPPERIVFFPDLITIFTHVVLLSAFFLGMCIGVLDEILVALSFATLWTIITEVLFPFLVWLRQPPPFPAPRQRFREREIRRKNRLLLRRALLIVASLPNMTTGLHAFTAISGSRSPKSTILNTAKLKGMNLDAVIHNIQASQHLQPLDLPFLSSFPILMDTGASCCTSPSLQDFEPGTLKDLPTPQTMKGIGGNVLIKQVGILNFKSLDDSGSPFTIRCPGLYIPSLETRLFSPQVFLATGGRAAPT